MKKKRLRHAETLDFGLPERSRRSGKGGSGAELDIKDLKGMIIKLRSLRRHFDLPENQQPIDQVLEIIYSLWEDWRRQAAERARDRQRRYEAARWHGEDE